MKWISGIIFVLLVVTGCLNLNKVEQRNSSESNNEVADYLTIGEKHYINAWELALVDSKNIKKIGEVDKASRLAKGNAIYEIEGYPERGIVAVKEEGSSTGLLENVTGFSIYVWYAGNDQPSQYPDIPESKVNQIRVYKGTKLINEWEGKDVQSFLELMGQRGAHNEFQFDRVPQYTVLYLTDGSLGYNYGILEKNGEFGLPHIESKLPQEIGSYFKEEDVE